jgi:hypothetical protein
LLTQGTSGASTEPKLSYSKKLSDKALSKIPAALLLTQGTSGARTEPKLSYSEQLSAVFDKEFKSIGIYRKEKSVTFFCRN